MIEKLVLASALVFAPNVLEDVVEKTPTAEVEQPTFEVKTFTMVDKEQGTTIKLTLNSETECKFETFDKENALIKTEVFNYTLDGNVLTCGEKKYTLNSNGTFVDYSMSQAVEDTKNAISEWASKYLNGTMVANVINWAIQSGLLVAVASIYFKYRKYKAMSSNDIAKECEKKINECLNASFKEMSVEQLKEIVDKVGSLEETINTLEKALVLAQDKTSEGKKALLDLITEKTNDKEVVETANEVKEKVVEEQKKNEEIKESVKEDYIPID